MDKNNFEKQVQETLAELSIQPSEKAWTGIESRIRKKDKSKRFLWLLLLGIILLTGGGYLFWQNGNGNDKGITQVSEQPTKTLIQKSAIDQKSSSGPISENPLIALNDNGQVPEQPKKRKNDLPSSPLNSMTDSQYESAKKETIINYPIENEKINHQVETGWSDIKIEEPGRGTNALIGHNETDKINSNSNSKNESANVSVQKETGSLSAKNISVAESLVQKQSPELKEEFVKNEKNDQNKTLKIEENKKSSSSFTKKWEIGFTLSAAKAYIGEGLQLGFQKDNADIGLALENMYDNSFNRPGSSIAQSPTGPASSPENSYDFNAGIVLKKEISPRISFVTGLGYTYYTNSILIGNQLDSGNYYSAGILSPYRNNIHFIDLPFSAKFHLNKNHKIPLDLSLGVNISQLVASNAVQYKRGFYEVDNSMFNKTQIGFNAGFSATFFHKLSVGPFYRYGLNSLAKEGLYGRKHLNFLGLKADFILSKNK